MTHVDTTPGTHGSATTTRMSSVETSYHPQSDAVMIVVIVALALLGVMLLIGCLQWLSNRTLNSHKKKQSASLGAYLLESDDEELCEPNASQNDEEEDTGYTPVQPMQPVEIKSDDPFVVVKGTAQDSFILCDASDYIRWNMQQIERWVAGLDSGRYAKYATVMVQSFAESGVCASDLPDLDEADLETYGVTDVQDRMDLKLHFEQLVQLEALTDETIESVVVVDEEQVVSP